MTVTVLLSDRVTRLLDEMAGELERLLGRRLSYEELIEVLVTKLSAARVLPDDVWY